MTTLYKDMKVRLVNDAPIHATARRLFSNFGQAYVVPAVDIGDIGVITKPEGFWPDTPTLAECRFEHCHLIVDRRMVDEAVTDASGGHSGKA